MEMIWSEVIGRWWEKDDDSSLFMTISITHIFLVDQILNCRWYTSWYYALSVFFFMLALFYYYLSCQIKFHESPPGLCCDIGCEWLHVPLCGSKEKTYRTLLSFQSDWEMCTRDSTINLNVLVDSTDDGAVYGWGNNKRQQVVNFDNKVVCSKVQSPMRCKH